MTVPEPIPRHLRPHWRRIPHLAWVVARAFGHHRRPSRLAGFWALAPAAMLYLPLLAGAALRRHLVTNPDHSGVVALWTGRRDRLAMFALAPVVLAAILGPIGLGAWLALDTVATWTGFVVVTVAIATVLTAILLPTLVEAAVMLGRAAEAVGAERYTAQLRSDGHTAWTIGPWAAWPPGRGIGTSLVDQLLPQVPPGVWLVALARDAGIAAILEARGFLTPAGGGLVRVLPPAGETPPLPGVPGASRVGSA